MTEIGFRQQIITTLALVPVTFGLWYAAGALLAGPAVWLAGQGLTLFYSSVVAETNLQQTIWVVISSFGEVNGQIVTAAQAGHNLALEIDTRLVSYSVPFYAALIWGSRVSDPLLRFCIGLFVLWVIMAMGLMAIAAKDLMLIVGQPFLTTSGVPPADVIAVTYQFSVLLAPTLAPVAVWVWQLKGTPLWEQLSAQLESAGSRQAPRNSA